RAADDPAADRAGGTHRRPGDPRLAGLGRIHGAVEPGDGAHRLGFARLRPRRASRPGAPDGPQAVAGAALEAASADLAGVSALASGLEAALLPSDLPPPSPASARLRLRSPSFLKSVSYQPVPASRNAGAVTSRRTWAPPQAGQASGSGSESFCRRSKECSHCSQRNA